MKSITEKKESILIEVDDRLSIKYAPNYGYYLILTPKLDYHIRMFGRLKMIEFKWFISRHRYFKVQ